MGTRAAGEWFHSFFEFDLPNFHEFEFFTSFLFLKYSSVSSGFENNISIEDNFFLELNIVR